MSTIEAVATTGAPAALGAYSQAVKANGLVFVSGQLGIDPETGELAGQSAGEQATQALRNISNILTAAGSDITRVVRTTIYYCITATILIIFSIFSQFNTTFNFKEEKEVL